MGLIRLINMSRKNTKSPPDSVFIETWEDASSAEEAARILGMKVDTARHKAAKLRKEGVFLSIKRSDINYKKLIAFAKSVQNKTADLTPREVVLLYLIGYPVKKIARLEGKQLDGSGASSVRSNLQRYRRNGVPLPHRRKRNKHGHERTVETLRTDSSKIEDHQE